jgi:hypothetical protein
MGKNSMLSNSKKSYFDMLPLELRAQILLELPIGTILMICNVYSSLKSICQSEYFWALKTEKDLSYPREFYFSLKRPFSNDVYPTNKPYWKYLDLKYYYQRFPSQLLLEAIRQGNETVIERALELLNLSQRDFSYFPLEYAFKDAIEQNRPYIVKLLIKYCFQHSLLGDIPSLLLKFFSSSSSS